MAKSPEAIAWCEAMLRHSTVGPPQGVGVGLLVPDLASVGDPVELVVVYEDGRRVGGVTVAVTTSSGRVLPAPRLERDGAVDRASVEFGQADLYSISVIGGGFASIEADVLVVDETG